MQVFLRMEWMNSNYEICLKMSASFFFRGLRTLLCHYCNIWILYFYFATGEYSPARKTQHVQSAPIQSNRLWWSRVTGGIRYNRYVCYSAIWPVHRIKSGIDLKTSQISVPTRIRIAVYFKIMHNHMLLLIILTFESYNAHRTRGHNLKLTFLFGIREKLFWEYNLYLFIFIFIYLFI